MLSLLSLVLSTTLLAGDQMATRTTKAARDEAGQINKKTFSQNGKEYPYWLYVPKGAKKDAPLILFLHGSGEREGGTKGPQEVGIGPAIAQQKDFPLGYMLLFDGSEFEICPVRCGRNFSPREFNWNWRGR